MLLNWGVGEDSQESFGVQEGPISPCWRNQSWIYFRRTDGEAETLIPWPPDVKNWLILKDPDAGKDGEQEKKGMTEDEMVGWHHRLDGHEVEQALVVSDGQGSQAYCNLAHGVAKSQTWLSDWSDWSTYRVLVDFNGTLDLPPMETKVIGKK